MASRWQETASPTRQRISFWLRLGLLPRIMFHKPGQQHQEDREHRQRCQICEGGLHRLEPVLRAASVRDSRADRSCMRSWRAFGNTSRGRSVEPTHPCHNWRDLLIGNCGIVLDRRAIRGALVVRHRIHRGRIGQGRGACAEDRDLRVHCRGLHRRASGARRGAGQPEPGRSPQDASRADQGAGWRPQKRRARICRPTSTRSPPSASASMRGWSRRPSSSSRAKASSA